MGYTAIGTNVELNEPLLEIVFVVSCVMIAHRRVISGERLALNIWFTRDAASAEVIAHPRLPPLREVNHEQL